MLRQGKTTSENCKNCGAPLKSSKCEYCGTEYGTTGNLEELQGKVTINGEEIEVRVSSVTNAISCDSYRDASGALHRAHCVKRTFTLVEV